MTTLDNLMLTQKCLIAFLIREKKPAYFSLSMEYNKYVYLHYLHAVQKQKILQTCPVSQEGS